MSHRAPQFPDTALLIAAHGSPGSQGGRTSTRKHTERIRERGLFAQVEAGFLTEKPFAWDVLAKLDAPEILIVPNTTANGYITTRKLPEGLKLTGRVTERIGPKGHQRLILTDPVGTHPMAAEIFARHIQNAWDEAGLSADDNAEVVVVGHGSTRGQESLTRTREIAREMVEYGLPKPPAVALLEEAPFVKDWQTLTAANTVLFAPFLISDGFHGSKDIPMAIGFDPGDGAFQSRLADGWVNETEVDGRRVLYLPPLGDVADMAELVVARATHARELFD